MKRGEKAIASLLARRSWRQIMKGHLTRSRIFNALFELRDPTTYDLMRRCRVSQGTVQRHVRALMRDGVVRYARKRKRDAFYTNRYELAAQRRKR